MHKAGLKELELMVKPRRRQEEGSGSLAGFRHLTLVSALCSMLWLTGCGRQQAPDEPHAAVASAPVQQQPPAPEPLPEPSHQHSQSPHTHAAGAAHQDHESKHGGPFFMALNEKHHLEGVLESPGTFRVFLYDDHTRPLSKVDVARADASVRWGQQEHAPATAMKLSADGATLQATAPAKVALPVEITLLIRFPGAAADTRPELFTFPFARFTSPNVGHKN